MRIIPVVAVALGLLAPAAQARPCYPTYCTLKVRVEPGRTTKAATKPFAEGAQLDVTEAYLGSRELNYWNVPSRPCVSFASGYGVLLRFNGCTAGTAPIYITVITLRESPVTLRIVYG